MKTSVTIILAGLILTASSYVAYSTETGTMICQGGIVSIGDTTGEAKSKCGEPATTSKREEKRITDQSRNGHDRIITTVSIDDWMFNFGPNQFQYQVIFENGRVARIESLNYGY